MKNKIKIILVIIIILVVLLAATIFSVMKFEVLNPFSSCFGMLSILYTDKEYKIVQQYPYKVMFSKTAESLDEYMKDRGFWQVKEEQMGSVLVYTNGTENEYISTSSNAYYSKCIWSE